MRTRNQIIVALAFVAVAAGTVAVSAYHGAPQGGGSGGMEGHNHAAMGGGASDPQPVALGADAARKIGVTYASVTRGVLTRTVKAVGIVAYDETRLSTITPKVEGWVERLYVDFTGAPVRAGQPLLDLYSPGLVTAQEELILARRLLAETAGAEGARAQKNALELVASARRRLEWWDIPEGQIQALEERGTVSRTLTLTAPASGTVLEKGVVEGARIMPGMTLFQIVDLSRVWVEAEVFEKDLSLVRLGQHGMVSLEAYPGEMFHGRVTYVYPTVAMESRTGKVRLEIGNPDLRLKPGMYARVELQAPDREPSLLIPRSAVLFTGERALVFVHQSDGRLHPRDVVVGLTNEEQVEVLSGLEEGDHVVSSANFLIDAESNLGAATAAMAGMDMGDMPTPGYTAGTEPMDHSGHDMSGMAMPPDTASTPPPADPHAGHDMGGMVMPPDTTPVPAPADPHAGHNMSGTVMPKDSVRKPDTSAVTPEQKRGGRGQGGER